MTQHKNIAAALAAAQSAMGKALKSASNPHFRSKYADLSSVMDACMPALTANGICVIQPVIDSELGRQVKTVLIHESGETLECSVPLLVGKNDMQGLGSAITYARRYGLMSMAGIAPEDDDGNAAVATTKGNPMGEAIGDAWRDAVLDSLPEGATAKDKAEAFAAQICEDLTAKKTVASLDKEWDKRKRMLDEFGQRFPDLYTRCADAYELRKMDIEPQVAAE